MSTSRNGGSDTRGNYAKNPCMGCTFETGRSPTCHCYCEKYKYWVKTKDESTKIGKQKELLRKSLDNYELTNVRTKRRRWGK